MLRRPEVAVGCTLFRRPHGGGHSAYTFRLKESGVPCAKSLGKTEDPTAALGEH